MSKISKSKSTARLWSDARFVAWNLLALALAPLLLLSKAWRYFKSRRRYEFESCRWSAASPTPDAEREWQASTGIRIVLCGVSFGEAAMMERLAAAILRAKPEVKIGFCIRDPNSRRTWANTKPDAMQMPWPYEWVWPIAKWLARYRPDLVVFTQSFRNRSLAVGAHLYGSKVVMFAGLFRTRRSAYYQLSAPLYRWLIGSFDVLLLADRRSCDEAKAFVSRDRKIVLTGDVKFDLEQPSLSEDRSESLRKWLAEDDTPILVAGSTETPEEERVVLDAFLDLRETQSARLLLAPRKVQRAEEVAAKASSSGFSVSRRSKNDPPADVMVLDTLGELAYAYQFAKAAYVGGAYEGEGHNVLEPLIYGVLVCYGMRRGHFEQQQKACEAEGLGVRIKDALELAAFWLSVLTSADASAEIRESAARILGRERGALDRSVSEILKLLP